MLATESAHDLVAETVAAPWERQPDETARMFAAFGDYRDMHPTVRSLAKVAERLGCSSTHVENLSRQHRWVERATAWADEKDRQRRVRLLAHCEAAEQSYIEISTAALEKIRSALDNLGPGDLKPREIPRLLEAVVRVQEMLFPAPTEMRQSGQVMTATEIRLLLREEKSLSTREHGPQPSVSPRLAAWVRGDDLDMYDHEHEGQR